MSSAEPELTGHDAVLVKPLLKFASHLFGSIKDGKKNAVMSPLSIHSALGMVLLGVEPGSKSEEELLATMKYAGLSQSISSAHEAYGKLLQKFREITAKSKEKIREMEAKVEKHEFISGNKPPLLDFWTMSIAGDKLKLQTTYKDQLKKFYNTSMKQVDKTKPDEQTRLSDEINKWGKEAGFAQNLVSPNDLVEADDGFTLLSAVNVQAFWFHNFREEQREDDAFYNFGLHDQPAKNKKVLGIMDQDGNYVRFTKDTDPKNAHTLDTRDEELRQLDFHVIDIPLIGNISFTIFEPLANGTGNELAELEAKLLSQPEGDKGTPLERALQSLDEHAVEINYLRMPAFKFEDEIDLRSKLTQMGLTSIFKNDQAHLTRMADSAMYVKKAKHQAMLEVTKTGLKASALTTVRMVLLSAQLIKNPIKIEVKHPFMFMIRYDKVPLFIGHLVSL